MPVEPIHGLEINTGAEGNYESLMAGIDQVMDVMAAEPLSEPANVALLGHETTQGLLALTR